jgi:bifunctional oligoribonuclease and PAP phosphatase NrnA
MKRSYGRAERLERVLEEAISELLLKGIKDPRVRGVTVTGISVSPDLSHATIYIATSRPSQRGEEESLAGVRSSLGFIRSELGKQLRLRYTPELKAELDRSLEEARRIETLITKLREEEAERESAAARSTEDRIARLAARLSSVDELILASHVDPDGDALGSLCAMALALSGAGKRVYASLAETATAPRTYRAMPGVGLLGAPEAAPDWPVVVALDVPVVARLGGAAAHAEKAELLVRIDHHPKGDRFGDFDVADDLAPSTSFLVWKLLKAMGLPIDADIAKALYIGLVTDTGRFQYSNATPAAFDMAEQLVRQGVRPEQVFEEIYDSRRMSALRLVALIINRASLELDGRLVWAAVSEADVEEAGAAPEETENLIDELRSIAGVEVALLLKVHPDGIRGSLRAKGDVDVAEIARRLGGGGHRAAAGFGFEGTVEEAVEAVRCLAAEAVGEPT